MKISDVSVVPLNYKLKSPFEFSGVKLKILEYALVRVRTSDGIVGFGECPAYWEPRNETQKSTIDAVNNISHQLVGMSCDNSVGRKELFKRVIPGSYAAQCGIDVACYDILGKVKGMPVAKLFGDPKMVPVEVAIPMTDQKTARSIVEKALSRGIQTFKIKVGKELGKELEIIKDIRGMIGNNLQLFVDANQAWKSVEEAVHAVNLFSEYNLCWVEQPMPVNIDIKQLKELKEKISVPIMLDESVYTDEDVLIYGNGDYIDMYNLKLAKTGGISGAIDFYNNAKKLSKKCMLGSMIEGALGTLAGLHFASVFGMETTALNAFNLIDDDLSFGPDINDGYMNIPENSGLGYLDESIFNARFSS